MTRTTADTEIITEAIHLACRAPSLHNSEPSRWVVGEAPVDRLRNVLAADRVTIQISGQTYEVVHRKIIDTAAAAPQLSSRHRRTFERFGIDNFMAVELAPTAHNDR